MKNQPKKLKKKNLRNISHIIFLKKGKDQTYQKRKKKEVINCKKKQKNQKNLTKKMKKEESKL